MLIGGAYRGPGCLGTGLGSILAAMASPEPQGLAGAFSSLGGSPVARGPRLAGKPVLRQHLIGVVDHLFAVGVAKTMVRPRPVRWRPTGIGASVRWQTWRPQQWRTFEQSAIYLILLPTCQCIEPSFTCLSWSHIVRDPIFGRAEAD